MAHDDDKQIWLYNTCTAESLRKYTAINMATSTTAHKRILTWYVQVWCIDFISWCYWLILIVMYGPVLESGSDGQIFFNMDSMKQLLYNDNI